MSKILLKYFFPITVNEPTPAASTAFLKQACIVVAPKMGVDPGVLHLCTTMTQVAAVTDNTEAQQLFNAGLSRVYVLPMDDLDLAVALAEHESEFYTLLISSDFDDADVEANAATGSATITSFANLVSGSADTVTVGGVVFTAQAAAVTLGEAKFQAATSNNATATSLAAQINAHAVTKLLVTATPASAVVNIVANEQGSGGNNIAVAYTDNDANIGITLAGLTGGKLAGGDGFFLGTFTGVVGLSSTDDDFLADQAVISNRSAFHTTSTNKAKNMFFAFGKLLSNQLSWSNQQYIEMPFVDDVDTEGECLNLFDAKINFSLSDDEYGQRLGLFACGGKAIVAPYITKNLEIDIQSAALTYITGNQPAYTITQASLIEDQLQKVIQRYIDAQEIENGTVAVTLEAENFVASSRMNISEPKALWRILGELRQTL